jgi:hypothetical protein
VTEGRGYDKISAVHSFDIGPVWVVEEDGTKKDLSDIGHPRWCCGFRNRRGADRLG